MSAEVTLRAISKVAIALIVASGRVRIIPQRRIAAPRS